MKKVCLLGDSIRMGYDEYVKEELKEFEVYYDNDDNGRFIHYTTWMFNQLNMKYGPFDYVHVNTGYWDLNTEGPKGENQTDINDYKNAFNRLIGLIKESGATPIIALTIPICEKLFTKEGYSKLNYGNDLVIKYNDKLLEVAKENNVKVNDLYSLVIKDDLYFKCPDSLHLTIEGYKTCAAQVAKIIRELDK